MRKTFVSVVTETFESSQTPVLLLGDIGVFGFRNLKEKFGSRVINMGILEQSMVGIASGLAIKGFIPTIHTIAPFMVERALEQIKIDFGYQKLAGNFVSVGASFDYAALGCTHHCPADVALISSIPSSQIYLPGSQEEFERQYRENWNNGRLNYFRLSEDTHKLKLNNFDSGVTLLKSGTMGTILVAGPLLENVMQAVSNLDISVIYMNEISDRAIKELRKISFNQKIVVVEPYYSGTITNLIVENCSLGPSQIFNLGVPREFLENYGTTAEHLRHIGLDPESLKLRIEKIVND